MVSEAVPVLHYDQDTGDATGPSFGMEKSTLVDIAIHLRRGKKINILLEKHLVTDASLSGWGAMWNGTPTQGRWSANET